MMGSFFVGLLVGMPLGMAVAWIVCLRELTRYFRRMDEDVSGGAAIDLDNVGTEEYGTQRVLK